MAVKQVHDQPLHGTQDDSSYRVVGAERTNRARGLLETHKNQPTDPTPRRKASMAPNKTSRAAPRRPKGQRARGPCAAAAKTAQRLPED